MIERETTENEALQTLSDSITTYLPLFVKYNDNLFYHSDMKSTKNTQTWSVVR